MQKTRFLFSILFLLFSGGSYAQESGLLLGLRSSEGIPNAKEQTGFGAVSYRTLWIAPQGAKVGVVAEKRGIYLPRKDGFWLVQVFTQQTTKGLKEDLLAAASIAKKPYLRSIDPEAARECDGVVIRVLSFVGNDYLTTEDSGGGYCEGAAHPTSWNTLSVFSLDKIADPAFPDLNRIRIKISQLLGAKADQALQEGAKPYFGTDGLYDRVWEENWALVRNKGKWKIRGRLGYDAEISRGRYKDFDVPLMPPVSLVGDDRLSPGFSSIQKSLPQAIDAFSSPNGDLLAVLTSKEIQIFTPQGSSLGNPVLKLPLKNKESVVMAQWATGKNVARWSELLLKVRKEE